MEGTGRCYAYVILVAGAGGRFRRSEATGESPEATDFLGIILAWGRGKRLGRNKALEVVGGRMLVRRVLDRLSQLADDVLVVVADQDQAGLLSLESRHRVILDLHPGGGPLRGVYSGLLPRKVLNCRRAAGSGASAG